MVHSPRNMSRILLLLPKLVRYGMVPCHTIHLYFLCYHRAFVADPLLASMAPRSLTIDTSLTLITLEAQNAGIHDHKKRMKKATPARHLEDASALEIRRFDGVSFLKRQLSWLRKSDGRGANM